MANAKRGSAIGLATWMTDPENDEDGIDFGVTPPRGPIVVPTPTRGGWPTNPKVKKPKKPKNPSDPNKFAR
jgi:hypothetical protein